MNTTIAATLIEANQNSNSPYERADMRLTAVMMAISTMPSSQVGSPSQPCRMVAPAIASTGTTMIQKHQRAGEQITQHDGRPGERDRGAAADEQPRADDAADRDHGDVAGSQRAAEFRHVSPRYFATRRCERIV